MTNKEFSDEFYNAAQQLSELMEGRKKAESNSCLISALDSRYFYLVTVGKYRRMELPIVTGGKD